MVDLQRLRAHPDNKTKQAMQRDCEQAADELEELRSTLAAVLALPAAEKELAYLRRGIGTATPNAAWLRAARLLGAA
jgi:hypothetical protein